MVCNLRREEPDDAAPAKPDAAAVAEGVVEPVCSALDLSQDLCIVLRDARRERLLPLLELLLAGPPVESGRGYLLKVRILPACR